MNTLRDSLSPASIVGTRSTSFRLPALIDHGIAQPLVSAVMVVGALEVTPQAALRIVGELAVRKMMGRESLLAGSEYLVSASGQINAAFSNGSFAIFAGAPGTVDVDNTNGQVTASAMQFATDGYLIQGEAVTLDGAEAIIRVGDGTAPGAGYVATISSVLQGSAQLVKRDLGTLVLTGDNTYTGGAALGSVDSWDSQS